MKTISINISNADYEWLSVQAKQRKMTVATIIEGMVSEASADDAKSRNSVKHLIAFVKQPTAFTKEDTDLLERIIMAAREGKVIPPETLRGDHESPSGDYND
ncbi:hypothetical protein IH992_23815 [Candidatus Poribacteria bacterium]|nr:hypothetical protein [Candidatus Poribacteria bacterium]